MNTPTAASDTLPKHLAIIMDGNGRWAKSQGILRVAGHQAGYEALRDIIRCCHQRGIEVLSLFAFSRENWRRPRLEVNALMALLGKGLRDEVQALHKENIRLRFIGDLSELAPKLQSLMTQATELTANNSGMTIVFAINYGGQWDITQAAAALASQVAKGSLSVQDITEQRLQQKLCLADCPQLDLVIRTSGERRLSNFFLWQIAYAELYFTETLWPDFNEIELTRALDYFAQRKRRFGQTDDQIRQQRRA